MTVKKEECLYQGTIKGSDIDTLTNRYIKQVETVINSV